MSRARTLSPRPWGQDDDEGTVHEHTGRPGPERGVMSAHRSIVVGVDGSDASLEAVVWGAREAA